MQVDLAADAVVLCVSVFVVVTQPTAKWRGGGRARPNGVWEGHCVCVPNG